jgi:hypothetical protein
MHVKRTENQDLVQSGIPKENLRRNAHSVPGSCVKWTSHSGHFELEPYRSMERDSVAVDFEGGLLYWNAMRQEAFVHWLQALIQKASNARLDWAHEGCFDSPSERESLLLRSAVERNDA